jgi:predicted Rdx family selenoprotein
VSDPLILEAPASVQVDVRPCSIPKCHLTLVAAIVDEEMVQTLGAGLEQVAWDHLGWISADFELHGNGIWQGAKHWAGKQPPELLAAYEAAIRLLDECDVDLAHSSIHKARLNAKYDGDSPWYPRRLQTLETRMESCQRINHVRSRPPGATHGGEGPGRPPGAPAPS